MYFMTNKNTEIITSKLCDKLLYRNHVVRKVRISNDDQMIAKLSTDADQTPILYRINTPITVNPNIWWTSKPKFAMRMMGNNVMNSTIETSYNPIVTICHSVVTTPGRIVISNSAIFL